MTIDDRHLKRLTDDDIATARRLCDEHVGAGLYTDDFLRSILDDPEHYFYLLVSDGAVIGYIYYRIMAAAGIVRMPGFELDIIRDLCRPDDPIAVFTSIGLNEAHRGTGLTDALLAYLKTRMIESHRVTLILAPAWKKGGLIPAQSLMLRNGYQAYCDLIRPWASIESLVCPYCRQERCQCNAVVYYTVTANA